MRGFEERWIQDPSEFHVVEVLKAFVGDSAAGIRYERIEILRLPDTEETLNGRPPGLGNMNENDVPGEIYRHAASAIRARFVC